MVNRVDELWSELKSRSAPQPSLKAAAAVLKVLNEQPINSAAKKPQTHVSAASGIAEAENVGLAQPSHRFAAGDKASAADLETRCRPLVQRLVDVSLPVRLSALTAIQVRTPACLVRAIERWDQDH
jgi:hypothetical protein